ncbi:MAG: hypothetical protein V1816_27815 [Pseudomonadota bacterium]
MSGDETVLFRPAAWNGLSLEVPAEWRLGTIDLRYLAFEDERGPTLEAKWSTIKGRFDFKKNFRRLAGPVGGKNNLQIFPLPAAWAGALAGFEVQGFSWAGGELSGRGVVTFCPTCRTAALLHFFHRPNVDDLAPKILASFRDHRDDGKTEYAVFDIKTRVPREFVLQAKKFQPGWFELNFTGPDKSAVKFLRFGPANILLSGSGLDGFAGRHLDLAREKPPDRSLDGAIMEWTAVGKPWAGLIGKRTDRILRLWTLEKENRILGVEMLGPPRLAAGLFDDLCRQYELV